jgi:hypothetical protein
VERIYLLWLPVHTNPLPLLRELIDFSFCNHNELKQKTMVSEPSARAPAPAILGGVAPATPPMQPIMAASPGTPRAGTTTSPPTHPTVPTMETMAAPSHSTFIIAYRRTTPMDQATVPPIVDPPSGNPFEELTTDAAGRGDTDNDATVLDDGLSPPLLNGYMPPPNNISPVAASPNRAAAVVNYADNTINPAVRAHFIAHNIAMSTALAEVTKVSAAPGHSTTPAVAAATTPVDSVAGGAEDIITRSLALILKKLDDKVDATGLAVAMTTMQAAITTSINASLSPIQDDLTTLQNRLNTVTTDAASLANTLCLEFSTSIRLKVQQQIKPSIDTLCHFVTTFSNRLQTTIDANHTKLTSSFADLNSGLGHVTKTLFPRINKWITSLEDRLCPPAAHTNLDRTPNPNSDIERRLTTTQTPPAHVAPHADGTGAPAIGTPGPSPMPVIDVVDNKEDDDPAAAGNLALGLDGPRTPFRSEIQEHGTLHNTRIAHEEGRQRRLAMGPPSAPYTPSQTPRGACDTGKYPPTRLGGPILSPWDNKQCFAGVNRFDIEGLAIPLYHGNVTGTDSLDVAYLAFCGFTMLSTDNVDTCYNNIITAHRRIWEGWHNPTANTYGPQIDHILLKSFKLFPVLESMATEDIMHFYDRLFELFTNHLLALMPFDAIVLKNWYEGLCIPGLGTRRYADMSRAWMDFLPRLVPGTLSSQINATLMAVQCETNNGYDYLWRVLKLTVPGFDPMVTILVPQWHDSEDIFQFSQAYLLYFHLQAKLQYHYTNRVRSSTFLCAIQQSDYADAVTTLQSHIHSYREEYDTGFLPAHLCIHGLAESIHLNAQNHLHDIASPRLHRIDTYRPSSRAYHLPPRTCLQSITLDDPTVPIVIVTMPVAPVLATVTPTAATQAVHMTALETDGVPHCVILMLVAGLTDHAPQGAILSPGPTATDAHFSPTYSVMPANELATLQSIATCLPRQSVSTGI